MPSVDLFSQESLRKISNFTCDIKTHGELTEIFQSIGLSEFDVDRAKHDRIYHALGGKQTHDKAGNIVLIFIQKILNPVSFVDNHEKFNREREKINTVLAFSGLKVNESGQVERAKKISTLNESEKKSNRLKTILKERNIHHDVIRFCNPELIEKNYFHCALEATKSLAEKIRGRSNIQEDGAALVDKVFGGNRPKVAFNSLTSEHEKSEQKGLVNLMKGVFGTFRNPTAHAPKIYWELTEQDALDLLSVLSYLHRRLESAVKTCVVKKSQTIDFIMIRTVRIWGGYFPKSMIMVCVMIAKWLRKVIQSIQIYARYFYWALLRTYIYYTSPFPIQSFLKQWSLANRALRVLWAAPSPGRKPLDQETIQLILKMKRLNPTWGGQRISDELAKIGYSASKVTVLKYLEIYGLHGPPRKLGPSWREFINNHRFKISIDFTSLISLTGYQIYFFVMINLDTRKLIFINATYSPSFEWVKQQFRNAFFNMDGKYPSLCICDRDQIFQGHFEKMIKDYFHIKLRRIPYKSPDKNGVVERFHLSLKTEAFDNVVPINLEQAQRICSEYRDYYNHYRPHQGIQGKAPEQLYQWPKNRTGFIQKKHLGGKIISFESETLAAA